MTTAEALGLVPGAVVVHPATPVRFKPIRVTDVWINEKRTIVLVRLASVDPKQWLDATGYDRPAKGTLWCPTCTRWETKAEHADRHPGELADLKKGVKGRSVLDGTAH